MDPTPAECNAWRTLEDPAEWVGMSEELMSALLKRMGLKKTAMFRQVAGVPLAAWNEAVPQIRVVDEDGPTQEELAPPTRALLPAELGFCGTFRRVVRMRMGAPAEEGPPVPSNTVAMLASLPELLSQSVSHGLSQGLAGSAKSAVAVPVSSAVRKIKMATVLRIQGLKIRVTTLLGILVIIMPNTL